MKANPTPSDRRISHLLAAKGAETASGILRVTRGKVKRLFCLDQGWIVLAASNILEEQFPEVLVRSGVLTPALRIEIVAESSQRNVKFGTVLEEKDAAPREALRAAMEHHVESLLSSCLEWPDGEASFDGGRPALDGETTVRLSPIQQILRHARRFPASIDALRLKIGPPNLRPVGTPAMASLAASLEPGGALGYALAQAQGALSVGEIAIASPAGEEPTLRAIYGLLLAGVIEPAAAHAAERRIAPGQREPALTRAEVEARLALAHDADHYTTLGLERTASMDRIRDAYYALARRYHPDRFRSGAIQNLLPRVERYFTQVTEAYNTLQHIDRRAEYDAYIEGAASESETSRGTDTAYLARQNFLRGRQLAERKRLAEALTFLENAVRLDAGVAEYHLDLGLLLARSPRRRAEAESELIAAAGLDPSIVAAYLGLGQLYERAGRRPEAARMFREVLRWDPGHAEASSLLAALGAVESEAGNAQFLRKVLGS